MGDTAEALAYFSRRGIRAMPSSPAIRALETSLDHDQPTVVVANIDWTRFAPSYTSARHRPLLEDLPENRDALAESDPPTFKSSYAERLLALSENERERALFDLVRGEVATVLGLTTSDQPEADRPLQELGLDSLMAVEIRNRLATATDTKLPATLLFDHPTVRALSRVLLALMIPHLDAGTALEEDGIRRLIASISIADLRSHGLLDKLLVMTRPREQRDNHDIDDAITTMDADELVALAQSTFD
jgi:acyl carrier protein